MTIAEYQNKNKNLPRNEMEVLFQFVLKINKTQLFLLDQQKLTNDQINELDQLVQRRLKGEPLAYLVEKKEFYGQDFIVDQNVLIPRPETEEMVEMGIKLNPATILDIGTGSGVIACTIAHNLPDSQVTALDISPEALKIASQNAKNLKLQNIEFLVSDFLTKIPKNSEYDLIITNPPYIKLSDTHLMGPETLAFEPPLALFSGEDGLDAYRQIFKQLSAQNIKFKNFLGEFGATQEMELINLLDELFYGKYHIQKDLSGIPRFIII